jgi:hypothetical protein
MATTAKESIVVRRPLEVVAKVATDPGVLLPLVSWESVRGTGHSMRAAGT